VTAARLLNEYGPIEKFPEKVLGDAREEALLFKTLATLRTDAELFDDVDELLWTGPTEGFTKLAEKMGDRKLIERVKECEKVREG
jgi:5'-3' exonuclease